jgi:hypothetical protein
MGFHVTVLLGFSTSYKSKAAQLVYLILLLRSCLTSLITEKRASKIMTSNTYQTLFKIEFKMQLWFTYKQNMIPYEMIFPKECVRFFLKMCSNWNDGLLKNIKLTMLATSDNKKNFSIKKMIQNIMSF